MTRTFLLILLLVYPGYAQDIPPAPSPPRLLTDFASALSDADRASLERKLNTYLATTPAQIAAVIVKTLGGYEVMDYACRIGKEWGVGQKGKENGIVVLGAIDDRKS